MTGFEPRLSGIVSNHAVNSATTAVNDQKLKNDLDIWSQWYIV